MNKTYILDEIRRTALANGGTPLGRRRFATVTGIKVCEWEGKLWARWSDAVREAGLTPNELQRAYPTAVLLEKFALLTQQLGRVPAANDLRLQDRFDPAFPSLDVFRRLGSKSELVRQVLEYCRERAGYEDVVRLCEYYLRRTQGESCGDGQPEEMAFVYLLKSGRLYKIGKSKEAEHRTTVLARQLPERAVTVHLIRTDDPGGIEAYWHKRFAATHQRGEWFKLAPADVAAFKRRKFM